MRPQGCLVLSTLGSAAGFAQLRCRGYCRAPGFGAGCRTNVNVSRRTSTSSVATIATLRRQHEHVLRCITRASETSEATTGSDAAEAGGATIVTRGVAAAETTGAAGTSRLEDSCDSIETSTSIRQTTTVVQKDPGLLPLLLLNVVTVLWGTQHAVIKLILQSDLSPGMTNLARFGVAALIFSPWTPGLLRDPPPLPFSPKGDTGEIEPASGTMGAVGEEAEAVGERTVDGGARETSGGVEETWRAGAELGAWMFLGFAFQAVGLGFTTASRSAFLLYLNVKLVPFFAFLLEGRSISIPTWIGAFLAFFGTILLSSDGTPPNVGDLWSVLAAATSAMFILRLEKYSGRCEASQLNSANLWVTAGLCGVWAAWEVLFRDVDPWLAIEGIRTEGPFIAYLAVVTTALTNWMQALGQRSVPAERAAVIYAMDPVYAAGFAFLLLGETLGPTGLVGAAIVTGAALWSQGQQTMEGGSAERGA